MTPPTIEIIAPRESRRAVALDPATIVDGFSSVPALASTETRSVLKTFTIREGRKERQITAPEVLLHRTGMVDLSRLHSGLFNHDPDQIVGPLSDVQLVEREGLRLRFGFDSTPVGEMARQRVASGSLRGVSISAEVQEYLFVDQGESAYGHDGPALLATRWQPIEASLTPIPADGGAGVFRSVGISGEAIAPAVSTTQQEVAPVMETDSNNPVPNAGTPPGANAIAPDYIDQVDQLVTIAGAGPQRAIEFIKARTPLETIRATLANESKARESRSVPLQSQVVADERDKFRTAAETSILSRCGVSGYKGKDSGEFGGARLSDLAAHSIRLAGGRVPMGTEAIFRDAMAGRGSFRAQGSVVRSGFNHTTSDFPSILANVMNKALSQAYMDEPVTYPQLVRTVAFSDFRPRYVNRLSSTPDPQKVLENGEIPQVSLSDDREFYGIASYGEIISVTRQTLINDDLGALTRLPTQFGAAFRRKIQKMVSDILNRGETSAYTLSDTGYLFNATAVTTAGGHANYGTTGTALAIGTLKTAVADFQKRVGLKGEPISVRPQFLVVPTDLEITASELVNQTLVPNTFGTPNAPIIRGLTVVPDRYLCADNTGGSATAWYLASSPSMIDTIELGLLNGIDAPVVEMEEGFDVLGMRLRAYMDFGAAPIDYRGLLKRSGAS